MNWDCPFCGRAQTVTTAKAHSRFTSVSITDHALGAVGVRVDAIGCANEGCKQLTLTAHVVRGSYGPSGMFEDRGKPPLVSRSILPDSFAKPQPDYIPQALREDYREACLIRDLSPKASATLARRCLQGMIRDFAKINRKTLFQEIVDLRTAVEAGTAPRSVSIESVDAIDHVRTVGNIGAHLEADVNHIIAVEPDEAQLLIDLIETLFEEWYVERNSREARLKAIAELSAAKKQAKEEPPGLLPPPS
jgi:hypothetical protein